MCPGPLCLKANYVMRPWAWSRPSGPVPFTIVMLCAWAFMFKSKPCDASLGLEPSLRAGSLYHCDALCLGLYV